MLMLMIMLLLLLPPPRYQLLGMVPHPAALVCAPGAIWVLPAGQAAGDYVISPNTVLPLYCLSGGTPGDGHAHYVIVSRRTELCGRGGSCRQLPRAAGAAGARRAGGCFDLGVCRRWWWCWCVGGEGRTEVVSPVAAWV